MYVCGLTEIGMYNHGRNSITKNYYYLFFWASLVVDSEKLSSNLLQLRRLKIGANFSAKAVHFPTY